MSEEYRNEIRRLFESVRVLHSAATEEAYVHVIALENFVINEYLSGTNNRNADGYLDCYYADLISVDELIEALAWPKECDHIV